MASTRAHVVCDDDEAWFVSLESVPDWTEADLPECRCDHEVTAILAILKEQPPVEYVPEPPSEVPHGGG